MIILLLITALAQEPAEHENRSEKVYKSFCVSCHGEQNEKTPYHVEETVEEKSKTIKYGTGPMPGYSWMLSESDIADLISYMDSFYKKD